MLAFRHHHDAPSEHPWQQGHAAPEDRAVGLELQLIELHHRRETADASQVTLVDAEIAAVFEELADLDELQARLVS